MDTPPPRAIEYAVHQRPVLRARSKARWLGLSCLAGLLLSPFCFMLMVLIWMRIIGSLDPHLSNDALLVLLGSCSTIGFLLPAALYIGALGFELARLRDRRRASRFTANAKANERS